MMAMISPSYDSFNESLSTLKFATRAKKIKNNAQINEDVDQKTLLKKYETELKQLRKELEMRNVNVDPKQLKDLETAKKRAEEEKKTAL